MIFSVSDLSITLQRYENSSSFYSFWMKYCLKAASRLYFASWHLICIIWPMGLTIDSWLIVDLAFCFGRLRLTAFVNCIFL